MARLAATVVLLLSLLAIASCRVIEAEPETVVAIFDEQSQADTAVPQETDAAEAIPSLPTVTAAESILRLPSHRRPCRHGFLHRHLRWARNHGLSHHRGAFSGPGDARVRPAFLPEEPREAVQAELEAVAEPDPDSRPDIEVEEVQEKDMKKPPRGDGDDGDENESVKAWKGEMVRRFRDHGLRFHHHHEHAVDSEHQEQQDKEEGAGDMQLHHVKLFSHHHNHGDEKQEETARIHHHHHSDNEVQAELEAVAEPDPDSRLDIEVEEVQKKDMKKPPRGDVDDGDENRLVKGEMVRRFRGHGLRFHHLHHRHEHAVEVEKDHSEHQEQHDKEEGAGDMQLHHVKLFIRHLHHHNHGDEEQEETARIHHHHHDSDNEVDEVEELARKLSKAIMRRSFSSGGIRHHLHHHTEEGGVRKWFKGLLNMNRF